LKHLHYPVLESTQTFAKENTHLAEEGIVAISADFQTKSITRTEKSPWVSPKSENIMVSFISKLPKGFTAAHNASQILASSAAKVLEEYGLQPTIKWPNDILIEGKKIAGILADLVTVDEKTYLINAIGLNVNSQNNALPEIAISMALIRGGPLPLQSVMEALLAAYEEDHALFLNEGFTPFYDRYKQLLTISSPIRFHVNQELIEGNFHSLAPNGTLNLSFKDGTIQNFFSCD